MRGKRNAGVFLMLLAAAFQAAAEESFLPRLVSQFEQAHREGRYAQAAMLGEGAVWLAQRVFKQPAHASGSAVRLLAESHIQQKSYAKAQYLYERLLGADGEAASSPQTGDVLMRLGDLQALQGKTAAAGAFYAQALDAHKRTLPPGQMRLTDEMIQVGNFHASIGDTPQAERLYRDAFEIRRQMLGEQDLEVSEASLVLADFYESTGHREQAERFYRLALSSQELSGNRRDRSVGITAILLARFHDSGGDAEAARRLYAKGAVTLAQSYGMRAGDLPLLDPDQGQTLQTLQPELLEEALKQSQPLAIAESLRNEAEAYISLGLASFARRAIDLSLKAYERALGPEHPELGRVIEDHARMLEQVGDRQSVRMLRRRMWELQTASP